MRSNLSESERWVRGTIGGLGVVLGLVFAAASRWSTVAWVAGAALVLTAAAGYCPLYDLLGMSSIEREQGDDRRERL